MILVDSNVWIGMFNENDEHHCRAMSDYNKIIQNDEAVITDYVLIEVLNVLLRKSGRKICRQFIEAIEKDSDVELLFTESRVFLGVMNEFGALKNRLSFVDCSLLHIAKSLGAGLLTYDKELEAVVK
jgi:predicted nucleic acid-binding protein